MMNRPMNPQPAIRLTSIPFPRVEGSNLEFVPYRLPGDFECDLNVAVVAYQIWHQPLVDSWSAALADLRSGYPRLRYYELPVIRPMGAFRERSLDIGMAVNIPDPEVRRRTITLYTDVGAFNRAVGIADTRDIQVLLIDSAGMVRWRLPGAWSPESETALRAAVAEVFGSAGMV